MPDSKVNQLEKDVSDIKIHVEYLIKAMDEIKDELSNKFVRKSEFLPVRILVYGFTGSLLLALIGALVSLVFK